MGHVGEFLGVAVELEGAAGDAAHRRALVLGQIPQTAVHDLLGDVDRLVGGVAPAGGAGGDDVDELRAADLACLLHLGGEVVEVADACGRGVGQAVGAHNLEEVLLLREAAVVVFAGGRGGGTGAEGREAALLDARVHVRLVVVADVDDVLVAVDGARQGLDADVGRAAVTGEAHHVERVGVLALGLKTCANAGEHRGCGRKGRDEGVVGEAQLGEVEAHGTHAAGRQRADRAGSQDLEGLAHHERPGASRAGFVAVEVLVVGDGASVYRHGLPALL